LARHGKPEVLDADQAASCSAGHGEFRVRNLIYKGLLA